MRYRILLFCLIVALLILAGYRLREKTPTATLSSYPDLGPAPELINDTWLNSDRPLRLDNLRGKVVLVDMWTFG
jgi:hypothetical protein